MGFIPGIAVTYPLTSASWAGERRCRPASALPDHFLDMPWLLVLGLVVGLPLLTAAVVGLHDAVTTADGEPAVVTATCAGSSVRDRRRRCQRGVASVGCPQSVDGTDLAQASISRNERIPTDS